MSASLAPGAGIHARLLWPPRPRVLAPPLPKYDPLLGLPYTHTQDHCRITSCRIISHRIASRTAVLQPLLWRQKAQQTRLLHGLEIAEQRRGLADGAMLHTEPLHIREHVLQACTHEHTMPACTAARTWMLRMRLVIRDCRNTQTSRTSRLCLALSCTTHMYLRGVRC